MKRLALFDNLKAFLIYCVVLGHLLELGTIHGSRSWTLVRLAIYCFHIPAFLFVRGLFAKTEPRKNAQAIIRLLADFLVMSLLVVATQKLTGQRYRLTFYVPVFSAWYLQSLILMRLALPLFERIPFALPLSVAIALVVPGFMKTTAILSLSRTVNFFPFFLAGYLIGPKRAASWVERTRQNKPLAVVVVLRQSSA